LIDLNIHKKFRHLLFGGLYFSEGLYQLLLVVVVPLYLLEKNVSIPIITLVLGLGEAPWALKFVWGGIADIYQKYGRRKFTIFGAILGAGSFFILSLIDQFFSIIFFTIFLIIGHIGIGFLDSSADAWAIDITKKEERGKINASMNSGKEISNALFSPIIIIIAITFGYHVSFFLMGLIISMIIILPAIVKETKVERKKEKIWFLMKNEFKKKSTIFTTIYIFLVNLNPGILVSLIVIYGKTVLNLDDFTIAIIGAIMLLSIVPGSYVGGFLADKYGRKNTSLLFLIMILFTTLGFSLTSDLIPTIILLAIIDFAWNGMFSSNSSLLMDITNPKIGASELSIISSIGNAGNVIPSAIAGSLVVLIGFNNIFILSSFVVIPPIIMLLKLIKMK
jgi:PAT family beta-lactamase induction signal transducer AmpG